MNLNLSMVIDDKSSEFFFELSLLLEKYSIMANEVVPLVISKGDDTAETLQKMPIQTLKPIEVRIKPKDKLYTVTSVQKIIGCGLGTMYNLGIKDVKRIKQGPEYWYKLVDVFNKFKEYPSNVLSGAPVRPYTVSMIMDNLAMQIENDNNANDYGSLF